MATTVGRLMLERALPPELRGGLPPELTKKTIQELFEKLAALGPDQYRVAAKRLHDLGAQAAYESGGFALAPRDLITPPEVKAARAALQADLDRIAGDVRLTPEQKNDRITKTVLERMGDIHDIAYATAKRDQNPLAMQVHSGAKGSQANVASLLAGDMLYADSKFRPIPFPVMKSYGEGLSPAEYFAGSFGARQGVTQLKLSTADAGYLSKRLTNAVHRLVVTAQDHAEPPVGVRGYPVSAGDPDNVGSLLAHPAAGYPRNAVITPKMMAEFARQGVDKVLVRSPLVGGPDNGGVYARDVGYREHGRLPQIGEQVGISASQSVAEPITQSVISSKHLGGVVGQTKGQEGFPAIDRLFSAPKNYRGGATHAQLDGRVGAVVDAPQGGKYVTVDKEQHYVPPDRAVIVRPGDEVEAGDVLSDGAPHPAELVTHKGLGEARRRFVDLFLATAKAAGFKPHRRNAELIARGYLNHVQLLGEVGDHVPGDVVPYQAVEASYTPRPGTTAAAPKAAVGRYLERPVLHHTIGTRVTKGMLPELAAFGVTEVHAHPEPPPFAPVLVRTQETANTDPDWMTRMLGTHLEKHLLKGVHRGDATDLGGSSFVPGLAAGAGIGRTGVIKNWRPTAAPQGPAAG